jgi:hypothetical protein
MITVGIVIVIMLMFSSYKIHKDSKKVGKFFDMDSSNDLINIMFFMSMLIISAVLITMATLYLP